MPPHFRLASLLIAVGAISLTMGSFSSHVQRRLIPIAEVVGQKYCSLDDNELFRADVTLRLKFENHTDKTLILDKQFGNFPSRSIIAKDSESLANRDYEYDPIFDSFVDADPMDFNPSIHLLHSNFVLLAPGQSFERVTTVGAFAWYVNKPGRKGAINYGEHVLQLGFVGWSYAAKASKFEEEWRQFGKLVTEEIYTEPIVFQIPRDPQIEKACN